jgi:carboxyl-terminal processing protease
MARITISYRRDDSGVIAGRIFDRLVAHYGRESIFRDIDNIPPGIDFRVHINEVLSQSDVILALVGPRWTGARGGHSRLGDEADPVRIEIEAALTKGTPLIPVLVMGATMPRVAQLPESLKDFAYRNAVHVDAGQDFDLHMARLIGAMDSLPAISGRRPPASTASAEPQRATGAAHTAITAAGAAAWYFAGNFPGPKPPRAPAGPLATAAPEAQSSLPPPAASASTPPPAPPAPPPDAEASLWQGVAASTSPGDFADYLRQFPQGRHAGLARERLAALPPPPAPPPAATPPNPEPPPARQPPSEQTATVQYPGFGGAAQAHPSSPAEIKQQLDRFAAQFAQLRRAPANPPGGDPVLKVFDDCFDKIRQEYVVEVSGARLIDAALAGLATANGDPGASDKNLIGGAINGMLTSLDPHSNYLNAKNYDEMKAQSRTEFGGLGLEVSIDRGLVRVVAPLDGAPAARAGLKPGDLVTRIDGGALQGMTLADAVQKMRGPVNTAVTLTIQRTGQNPFDVTLVRAKVVVQPVRSTLEAGNIGYIRISTLPEQTDVRLGNAMQSLKQQAGNKLAGVILDLRNSPGGLLDQSVAVADAFLDAGEILTIRGRHAESYKTYSAHPGDLAAGLPLVVLINKGTASGSEIIAAALQDNHRATLVGTPSFGKGTMQTVIPLPDGYGAMRLTTALDMTPAGRLIQGVGITPDKIVEAGDSTAAATESSIFGGPEDRQYSAAIDLVRSLSQRH